MHYWQSTKKEMFNIGSLVALSAQWAQETFLEGCGSNMALQFVHVATID